MDDLTLNFFPSYYDFAKTLPAKKRLAFYDAVMEFFFDGKECDASNPAFCVFMLVKPNLAASKRMKAAKKKRNTSAKCSANTSADTSAKCSADTCGKTSSYIGKGKGIGVGIGKGNTPFPPRRHPTLEQVVSFAKDPTRQPSGKLIPEQFARDWFALMECGTPPWTNTHGKPITNWTQELIIAWKRDQRFSADRKGGKNAGATNQPEGVIHHEAGYVNPLES